MLTDSIEALINHESCFNYKLCIDGRPSIPSPKRKYNTFEVYGSVNGDDYEFIGFENVEYGIQFNYLEDVTDNGTFKNQFRRIKRWLLNAVRLEFSDEPDVFYMVKKVEIGDAENDIVEYGSFEVKFTLAPFGRLIENGPLSYEKTSADLDIYFDNPSIIESPPVIALYGSGDATIYLNSVPVKFTGIDGNIAMDSDLQLTYKTDNGLHTNQSDKQSSNGYLKLLSGENHLIVMGPGITKVEIWRNSLV